MVSAEETLGDLERIEDSNVDGDGEPGAVRT